MAGRLFELQSRNGILEEKDRRLYEYAYGVLLGRVVIYLIIVILVYAAADSRRLSCPIIMEH